MIDPPSNRIALAMPPKHSHLVVGMSHVEALRRGWIAMADTWPQHAFEFVNLRAFRTATDSPSGPEAAAAISRGDLYPDKNRIRSELREAIQGSDTVLLCISGNEHNVIGLSNALPLADAIERVKRRTLRILAPWLDLVSDTDGQQALLVPPPPIESESFIRAHPGPFRTLFASQTIRPAADRLALWRAQRDVLVAIGRERGMQVLHPPVQAQTPDGYLADACRGIDPTHGNSTYGRLVLADAIAKIERDACIRATTAPHPYSNLPGYAYWQQAVSDIERMALDPVVSPRFRIDPVDRVATAGSCFAQHISRRLRDHGFSIMRVEPDDDETKVDGASDYDFSARYGNIYTSRQLLQLFDRAFGDLQPTDVAWKRPDGRYCDPFRPRIAPEGFESEEAVRSAAMLHLNAVRAMFERLDVFVFTLGLTECWVSRLDGAAYPVAPGVAGGRHDPALHAFVNLTPEDVRADLDSFVTKLKIVNPDARVLLTVSPVPLVATYASRHVLVSNVYSKSALRVAVEQVVTSHSQVEYFPSYEIITGPHAEGGYFARDRRSVTEAGVDHVMRVFMSRMTTLQPTHDAAVGSGDDAIDAAMEIAADAACDEELYRR